MYNKLNREHVRWTLSQEQRKNVDKLLTYLEGGQLRAGFTMGQFSSYESERVEDCGTAGCIIGNGPDAGIPKSADENWRKYGTRCFNSYDKLDIWDFMFHASWEYVDDSLEGAVKRVKYALEHGIPLPTEDEEYDAEDYIQNINRELNETDTES